MLTAINFAIKDIQKIQRINEQRPIEGDLFCPPVPNYHPTFSSSEKTFPSPLHWNREPIELKELLTALDIDEAFVNKSGDKVPFTQVVKCFEGFFNVELGSSREVKRLTFDRGERISVTQYLDVLVSQMNKEKAKREKHQK